MLILIGKMKTLPKLVLCEGCGQGSKTLLFHAKSGLLICAACEVIVKLGGLPPLIKEKASPKEEK